MKFTVFSSIQSGNQPRFLYMLYVKKLKFWKEIPTSEQKLNNLMLSILGESFTPAAVTLKYPLLSRENFLHLETSEFFFR